MANPPYGSGRRLDAETGLYYYRARYYDPQLGRFLQTDPIGYKDQMNLYGYVGNDPVNKTDPSGNLEIAISAFSHTEDDVLNYSFQDNVTFEKNQRALNFVADHINPEGRLGAILEIVGKA